MIGCPLAGFHVDVSRATSYLRAPVFVNRRGSSRRVCSNIPVVGWCVHPISSSVISRLLSVDIVLVSSLGDFIFNCSSTGLRGPTFPRLTRHFPHKALRITRTNLIPRIKHIELLRRKRQSKAHARSEWQGSPRPTLGASGMNILSVRILWGWRGLSQSQTPLKTLCSESKNYCSGGVLLHCMLFFKVLIVFAMCFVGIHVFIWVLMFCAILLLNFMFFILQYFCCCVVKQCSLCS